MIRVLCLVVVRQGWEILAHTVRAGVTFGSIMGAVGATMTADSLGRLLQNVCVHCLWGHSAGLGFCLIFRKPVQSTLSLLKV